MKIMFLLAACAIAISVAIAASAALESTVASAVPAGATHSQEDAP